MEFIKNIKLGVLNIIEDLDEQNLVYLCRIVYVQAKNFENRIFKTKATLGMFLVV